MSDGIALVERLVLFGHELRAEGLSVGSGDVMTFCAAAAALNPGEDPGSLLEPGRTTLVTRRDQIPVYDRVFRRFFLDQSDPPPDERTPPDSAATDTSAVLQIPDNERGTGEEQEDTKITLGLVGADAEIWRQKWFSACTPSELRAPQAHHGAHPPHPTAAAKPKALFGQDQRTTLTCGGRCERRCACTTNRRRCSGLAASCGSDR